MTESDFFAGPASEPQRYRVHAEQMATPLGGGEGLVYKAIDDRTGAAVALKMLTSMRAEDFSVVVSRLKSLEGIDHRNVMRQRDAFIGAALSSSPPSDPNEFEIVYTVAEWVDGETLADAGKGDGWRDALASLSGVADGLWFLGSRRTAGAPRGLVHRDVKPSNIRLRPDGSAVLIDFGVARPITEDEVTRGVGTYRWRAPEVLSGPVPLSTATDAWGLGATAYWLLVGEPPSLEGVAAARERLLAADRTKQLSDPAGVAIHVASLLETNPDKRPKDLRKWGQQLTAMLSSPKRTIFGWRQTISGIGYPTDGSLWAAVGWAAKSSVVFLTGSWRKIDNDREVNHRAVTSIARTVALIAIPSIFVGRLEKRALARRPTCLVDLFRCNTPYDAFPVIAFISSLIVALVLIVIAMRRQVKLRYVPVVVMTCIATIGVEGVGLYVLPTLIAFLWIRDRFYYKHKSSFTTLGPTRPPVARASREGAFSLARPTSISQLKAGSVWYAHIRNDVDGDSKPRPVIVVEEGKDSVVVAYCTSSDRPHGRFARDYLYVPSIREDTYANISDLRVLTLGLFTGRHRTGISESDYSLVRSRIRTREELTVGTPHDTKSSATERKKTPIAPARSATVRDTAHADTLATRISDALDAAGAALRFYELKAREITDFDIDHPDIDSLYESLNDQDSALHDDYMRLTDDAEPVDGAAIEAIEDRCRRMVADTARLRTMLNKA